MAALYSSLNRNRKQKVAACIYFTC